MRSAGWRSGNRDFYLSDLRPPTVVDNFLKQRIIKNPNMDYPDGRRSEVYETSQKRAGFVNFKKDLRLVKYI